MHNQDSNLSSGFLWKTKIVVLNVGLIFLLQSASSGSSPIQSSPVVTSKEVIGNATDHIAGVKNVQRLLEDANDYYNQFHNLKSFVLSTEIANSCFDRINSNKASENDYFFFVSAQLNKIRLCLRDSNLGNAEVLLKELQHFIEKDPSGKISKSALIKLKALVYWEVGDVQFANGNYETAISFYDLPFKLDSTGILQIEEREPDFLKRRSTFLTRKALAVKYLSKLEHCLAYLSNSMTTADTLIMWYPALADGYEIKAEILREKGLTQFELSDFEESLKSFKQAINLHLRAQKIDSKNLDIQNNLGQTLALAGYLNIQRGHFRNGKSLLDDSLKVLGEASKAPDNQIGRIFKAQAFQYDGISKLQNGFRNLADSSFRKALTDIQIVLEKNPRDVLANKVKLEIQTSFGELKENQGMPLEAFQIYEQALNSAQNFKTPELEMARSILFRKIASIRDKMKDFKNRDLNTSDSIKILETACKNAPKNTSVLIELGITLEQMGSYSLIDKQQALERFNQANLSFEKAEILEPSSIKAHYERAKLIYKIAETLADIPTSVEALKQYSVALGEFNQVCTLDPKFQLDKRLIQKLTQKRKEYLRTVSNNHKSFQ